MTREGILGEGGDACEYGWDLKVIPYDTALKAMDEYAKQEVIAFEDWKRRSFIEFNSTHGKQYYEKVAGAPLKRKIKNSEQLYKLFLSHQSKKP